MGQPPSTLSLLSSPTEQRDHKGTRRKINKRYRDQDIATPYEKLKSLPNAATFLKPGVTFQHLDAIAYAQSDLRRRPRSQCRPRRTVPNHRLRVGTRRRVTPPSHTASAFPTTPSSLQCGLSTRPSQGGQHVPSPPRLHSSTVRLPRLTCLPIPPRCTLSFYIQPLGPQPDSPPLHALRSGSWRPDRIRTRTVIRCNCWLSVSRVRIFPHEFTHAYGGNSRELYPPARG